jgi:hypothetical protein
MPAGLPGDTLANNLGNPSAGAFVLFDLLSGPLGSPFDNDIDVTTDTARTTGVSTGALSTGIGFGSPPVLASGQIGDSLNFTDDYTPGVSTPTPAASADSTYMYIGGGKCTANVDGAAPVVPYTAGFGIGGAGNSGSRDAGAGPAFTGFLTKLVTATGAVANGAAVEVGWTNRSGQALVSGDSVFGSSTAASATPA